MVYGAFACKNVNVFFCVLDTDVFEIAKKLEEALFKTLRDGRVLTKDLGGNAKTTEFRDEIIKNLG